MTSGRGSQSDLAPSPTRISLRHRRRIVVTGVVQGVGFRPFVYTCASRYGLSGWVRNDANGVVLEVEGDLDALASFVAALHDEIPPLAVVETVDVAEVPTEGGTGFAIGSTDSAGSVRTLASPDIAMCADCVRRARRPARPSLPAPVHHAARTAVPGSRSSPGCPTTGPRPPWPASPCATRLQPSTTTRRDRRFHAQPIACPDCGPTSSCVDGDGAGAGEDALAGAAPSCSPGAIVAVKGLGGYHLACDATQPRPPSPSCVAASGAGTSRSR